MQVLIIGASRGLGLEFVRQYRADGACVTATARDAAGLERLRALGATAFELDVAGEPDAGALSRSLDRGPYDIVVHNAGVYGPRTQGLQTPSREEFDLVMHTNLLGAMRVLPSLAAALAPGARVALLSSRMGSIGLRSSSSGWLYRASKAALNSVLKDAALEWQGRALCVALHPGWVRTDMGGSGAEIDAATSVAGMRRVIGGLSADDHGAFFDWSGARLAW